MSPFACEYSIVLFAYWLPTRCLRPSLLCSHTATSLTYISHHLQRLHPQLLFSIYSIWPRGPLRWVFVIPSRIWAARSSSCNCSMRASAYLLSTFERHARGLPRLYHTNSSPSPARQSSFSWAQIHAPFSCQRSCSWRFRSSGVP